MFDIEIKRGYEVLLDNNVRFGIKIINTSDFTISDVEVILDYSESLFNLEGEKLQKLGHIPPANARTAEFILKPLGCVHKVEIEAIISYRDSTWKKHLETMRPKDVHCVCPFLKENKMSKADFFKLSKSGYSTEIGLNFKGVTAEQLTSFFIQSCKSRYYKVEDLSIDGGRMLYLASESIGEKAYYLLTVLVMEDEGVTQVILKAVSDKSHGLNGLLNETVAELRHVVDIVQSAQEIGIIRKEQVINIIDSVVQRTSFSGGEGAASVNIEGSVVQRTEFKSDDEQKRRWSEEKEKKKRKEEVKQRQKLRTNMLMLAIVLGALLFGFWAFALDLNKSSSQTDAPALSQDTDINSNDMEYVTQGTVNPTPTTTATATETPQPKPTEVTPIINTVPQEFLIRIDNYMFIPVGDKEINVGDTIKWRNFEDSKQPRYLVSENGIWEEEQYLPYMGSVSYTFNEIGVYTFYLKGRDTKILTITVV